MPVDVYLEVEGRVGSRPDGRENAALGGGPEHHVLVVLGREDLAGVLVDVGRFAGYKLAMTVLDCVFVPAEALCGLAPSN